MTQPYWAKVAYRCLLTGTVSASAAGLVHAQQQCPLIPTGVAEMEETERAQMLGDFKYAELEKELAKQHSKNLSSAGADLLTVRDLLNMQQVAGGQENLMRMWADERPQSFFAQLNAGLYYVNQAFYARGNEAASQTSSAQMRKAKQITDVAQGYLQKAMALDLHSALPSAMMIGLASIQGEAGGRNASQWLQAANQIDPKNLSARIQAVNYLSPRWGGSFEALDQMASQADGALSKEGAHYLKYNIVIGKASHYEVIERNGAKALEFYKQAKAMCDNSQSARSGIVRNYGKPG